MTDLDPNRFRAELNATLTRFVATSAPVNEVRAPALSARLRAALADRTLVRGPYLETLPDFEKGRSIERMVEDGALHPTWAVLAETSPGLFGRPLHAHQEAALLRADHYLVATGTGSGKTEGFLYPMVDDLLRQGDLERPGVRALLVYPLNALASDQLLRIATLLFRDLGNPGITLGRYTGQVTSSATRAQEEDRLKTMPSFVEAFGEDAEVPSTWLLAREEMRATPPHLLITNYSMLEHILLLPTNRPVLNGADLRWIVLDEVHTYTGAQAIEVAFLLRRLKAHTAPDRQALRCVGTSASLDPDRRGELAGFASTLFGERFDGADAVITSARRRHPRLDREASPSGLDARRWAQAVALSSLAREQARAEHPLTAAEWNAECELEGLPELKVVEDEALGDGLIGTLSGFSEVHALVRALEGGARRLEALAQELFPNVEPALARDALVGLVSVGVLAVSRDARVFPLLPARYHLIASSVDRVGVTLSAEGDDPIDEVRIGEVRTEDDRLVYPLLVCRSCGEPYLEAWEGAAGLETEPLRPAQRRLLRPLPGFASGEEDDAEEETAEAPHVLWIDPATGTPLEADEAGAVGLELVALRTDDDERSPHLAACVACGHRSSRHLEPVTTVHPGDDAFAAVAAQALIEALPTREVGEHPPMGGRNLLSFSDNRQDAAFFAPFFERTSRDQAIRGAVLRVVERAGQPLDLDNLVTAVRMDLREQGLRLYSAHIDPVLQEAQNEERRLKALIVAELTVFGTGRLSLEGFGLVHVTYDHLDRVVRAIDGALPGPLKPYALPLAQFLLKAARNHRAVALSGSGGVDLTDESIWNRVNNQEGRCVTLEKNPRATTALHYMPVGTYENRFTRLIEKMGHAVGVTMAPSDTRDVLQAFFRALQSPRSMMTRHGVGLGLKLDGTLKIGPGAGVPLYRCDACGTRTQFDTAGICPARRCDGHLVALDAEVRAELERRNHYVARYRDRPMLAIAREHTAAIADTVRGRIEEDFKRGEVNLLSCTTTMEMGVDLGDLEAVLCKNVPPSIASYQQRSGRAGRRAQVAPLVLTTARSGRYDQAVFARFDAYLAERPRVPYLSLDNSGFFQRHQMAVVLASYIDHRLAGSTRSGAARLRDVVGEVLSPEERDLFDADLEAWMAGSAAERAFAAGAALSAHLPDALQGIALDANGVAARFRERIAAFADSVFGRWQLMQDGIAEIEERRRTLPATDGEAIMRLDRAAGALRTQQALFLQQFLVEQLSKRAVIPTYAFPVHAVSLEVVGTPRRAEGGRRSDGYLELDRDGAIGITEYAPGAEVVAGGRVWTSVGISKRSRVTGDDAFVERQQLRVCSLCGCPQITEDGVDPDPACGQCGATFEGMNRTRRIVRPVGFLTSCEDPIGRDPGAARIRPTIADDARLLTHAPRTLYTPTDVAGVLTFHAPGSNRPEAELGRIITVNTGPRKGGFSWCRTCERAVPVAGDGPQLRWQRAVPLEPHRNPRTGLECRQDPTVPVAPVDLAHVFETDVRAFLFDGGPRDATGAPIASDGITWTLQEALRLGAVRLLETDPRDVRALQQTLDGDPIVVLYDAVSGGAGYAARLTRDAGFAMADLLEAARAVLDCTNASCQRACVRCLQDYSNQRIWHLMDRRPALAWVEALLA